MKHVFDPEILRARGREQEGNGRGLTERYRWPRTP